MGVLGAHVSSFVVRLFALFEEKNVDWLVLRNYEKLPYYTDNDIDILIKPEQIREATLCLIEAADDTGWRLHAINQYACRAFLLHDPSNMAQLHVDFMHGIKWHCVDYFSADEMLAERKLYNNIYIPLQHHEAIVSLMTSLLYGGFVKEKYRVKITQAAQTHGEDFASSLTPWLGEKLAKIFVEAALLGKWSRIEEKTRQARVRVVLANFSSPFRFLKEIMKEMWRLIGRVVHPVGMTLAISGFSGNDLHLISKEVSRMLAGSFYPGKGCCVFLEDKEGGGLKGGVWLLRLWCRLFSVRFRGGLGIVCVNQNNKPGPAMLSLVDVIARVDAHSCTAKSKRFKEIGCSLEDRDSAEDIAKCCVIAILKTSMMRMKTRHKQFYKNSTLPLENGCN